VLMSVNGEFHAPADVAQGKESDISQIWYGLCGFPKIRSTQEPKTNFSDHLTDCAAGYKTIVKGKAVPLKAWGGPEGSRKLRFLDFLTAAQDVFKVVSLTHRPHFPPGNTPGTHFCWMLSRSQGHSVIRRFYVHKKFHVTLWDRTSDLLICSAVP
jgi:hypothetical protein